MPSFPNLQDAQLSALLRYVETGHDESASSVSRKQNLNTALWRRREPQNGAAHGSAACMRDAVGRRL
jgi:hypothetical protein